MWVTIIPYLLWAACVIVVLSFINAIFAHFDYLKRKNTSYVITLPAAAWHIGRTFNIKNTGTEPMTIKINGNETIDIRDCKTQKFTSQLYKIPCYVCNGIESEHCWLCDGTGEVETTLWIPIN